jgi:hypothetical protein
VRVAFVNAYRRYQEEIILMLPARGKQRVIDLGTRVYRNEGKKERIGMNE